MYHTIVCRCHAQWLQSHHIVQNRSQSIKYLLALSKMSLLINWTLTTIISYQYIQQNALVNHIINMNDIYTWCIYVYIWSVSLQSEIYDYCEHVSITPEKTDSTSCIDPERNHLCDTKGYRSVATIESNGQRNSLPISSVCCRSLSERYVNFITSKEAEKEEMGGNKAETLRRCRIRFTYFSVDHIDRLSRGSIFLVHRNNVEVIPPERSRWDCKKEDGIFVPTR